MTTQVIRLDKKLNHTIIELSQDLRHATKSLTKREWVELILKTASVAGHETIKTKIKALKNAGQYLSNKIRVYSRNPKRAATRDLLRTRKAIAELPENVRQGIIEFKKLSRNEQCESAIIATITLIIFFGSMGGFDAEGGLPDQDLKLGIGKHRNIISHSIILGFGIEFAMRFVILFLLAIHSQLPSPHHKIWDKIESIIQKSKNLGIAAMWAGIGLHLFKDAGLFSKRIKPYAWLPGHHSMAFHKSLFATNAAVAGTISAGSING